VISVDTGAWFAAFVSNDPDHSAANEWLAGNDEPLLTTDYVLDEVLTLSRARGEWRKGVEIGRAILEGSIASLEWVGPEDVVAAFNTFQQYPASGWSFTDCVSRAVIQRLSISTAFAFDDHFRQFGDLEVVPG